VNLESLQSLLRKRTHKTNYKSFTLQCSLKCLRAARKFGEPADLASQTHAQNQLQVLNLAMKCERAASEAGEHAELASQTHTQNQLQVLYLTIHQNVNVQRVKLESLRSLLRKHTHKTNYKSCTLQYTLKCERAARKFGEPAELTGRTPSRLGGQSAPL